MTGVCVQFGNPGPFQAGNLVARKKASHKVQIPLQHTMHALEEGVGVAQSLQSINLPNGQSQ